MTSSLAPPPTFVAGRDRKAPVIVGVSAVVGTVVLALGNPNTTHVPLCPLHAATGLDCPFCGGLRSVHSLAHLDLAGALDHNLLLTLGAPLAVAAWVIWLLRSFGRAVLPRWQLPAATTTVLMVLALVFGVLRNLPALSYLGSGT
ncbi:hypothetical protein BH10ACT1_BH10ACT1_38240 [soil metagenome]